jgi:hypothetical protein
VTANATKHPVDETPRIPAIPGGQLTHADLELLAFERTPWRSQGRKTAAIRARFGLSATRYSHRLTWILTTPDAETYDPELVRRLRRIATHRKTVRDTGFAAHTGTGQ